MMANILVTGGSGYIGSWCLLTLLAAGHTVRTTVRDLSRAPSVREMLRRGGAADAGSVRFFAADLEHDAGWDAAVAGCDAILHVASPTLVRIPRDDDEMVRPARDGVLRVLRAAHRAGVRRVVLTSAFGAVGYGHPPRATPFTEADWTDVDAGIPPYQKSKTLAERAAWDFVRDEAPGLELVAINPVGVLGPLLGPDYSPSLTLIRRMLDGSMPAIPRFAIGFVDVRDVADLHLRAIDHPAAAGERFLAVSGRSLWIREIAALLRERLGARASRVPTRELPIWVARVLALVNPGVKVLVPHMGKNFDSSGEKAMRLLGWQPRPIEGTIVETAEALLALAAQQAA
ncbi:SDR family oxidoreductase [Burkholderia plantarii]|uniref:Putative NAD-dependent epimerase/dehydratase n=1 Tax=Burkholderia plantarii TaxID=41899 RepID=A0A0B6S1M0_BURPL|nr:aldehyde reductase [Burkholderia plantarii]AJK48284.1 putative NAD-dependent epimerase/dehydratase [Burkholderia plantarii]